MQKDQLIGWKFRKKTLEFIWFHNHFLAVRGEKVKALVKATVATFCSENVHDRPAAFIDHVPTCLILLKKTNKKQNKDMLIPVWSGLYYVHYFRAKSVLCKCIFFFLLIMKVSCVRIYSSFAQQWICITVTARNLSLKERERRKVFRQIALHFKHSLVPLQSNTIHTSEQTFSVCVILG